MGEEFFDEHFQQISPVTKHILDERFSINDSYQISTTSGLESIQSSIGSRATFVS